MAPKIHPLSHRPSKKEQDRELSSDDDESESQFSDRDKVKANSANSSDDDETEEGSSSDEEVDRETVRNNKPPIQLHKFESKTNSGENESDSEPDSEGVSPSNYKMQPIRKPPSTPSAAKRPRPDNDSSRDPSRSNSKKPKTEENNSKSSSTPGGCITKLWSDADEIAVLNGILEFRKEEGNDPNSEGLYNLIKGKLQADFSREQLRTKIGRIKKRFLNAMKKAENGTDPVFSKPHEYNMFELSKKIWGSTINNRSASIKIESAVKEIVKPEKVEVGEKDDEEGDFWSKYPYLSLSFDNVGGNFPSVAMSQIGTSFMKERVSLFGNAKAKELDDKWRQLILEQTELNHKMLALMTEQVRTALNQ